MAGEWRRALFQYDPVGSGHTFDYVLDKIESALTQSGWVRPSWDTGLLTRPLSSTGSVSEESRFFIRSDRNTQDRWRYRGDNVLQHGGIIVSYDSNASGAGDESGPQIVIQTFLENTAASGIQVSTRDIVSGSTPNFRTGSIRISLDNFSVNTFLIYVGEDGLYIESGANGLTTNLGHGAVMTFGAIPELHGTREVAVQWTAQGLVCDFTRNCKFTASRDDRFVTNDGLNKNFTASLQPETPRGTANIEQLAGNVSDNRAYYIGSRDTFMSMGIGRVLGDNSAAATSFDGSVRFAATFGLFSTPRENRFRLSQLLMLQSMHHFLGGVNSSSGSNNVAGGSNEQAFIDVRNYRQIFRFAAVDYTLLPGINVVDAITGASYRVQRIEDNGRFSQIGIEVPSITLTLP